MKTFILFWNPAISNWKLVNDRNLIDRGDIYDCTWSVWEHEQAEFGDRFFLVRCGEGNTGICQSGRFSSKPFLGEDWSGKGREVYYVKLDIEVIIDSEYYPILTTEVLQKEMPDFDWTGGHSGRILQPEYAERLEQLWAAFLEEHKAMFHQHAIRRTLSDEDYIVKDEDEKHCILGDVIIQPNGEIMIEIMNEDYEKVVSVKAWTLREAKELAEKMIQEKGLQGKVEEYDYEFLIDYDMTAIYEKALDIASWAHHNQKDKAGKPYFGHPARVSKNCKTPLGKIAALLHDVVEDTDITPDRLEELGIPEFIVKIVMCVTRQPEETYDDFIVRLSNNSIAREVKIADLEDNMDVRRLEHLNDEDTLRLNKYIRAWRFLKNYHAEL